MTTTLELVLAAIALLVGGLWCFADAWRREHRGPRDPWERQQIAELVVLGFILCALAAFMGGCAFVIDVVIPWLGGEQ